jgi:hypothetical protein
MTLEEAVALALEEGMRTEPVPDNAMAMLLHRRIEPSDEHIDTLIEALRTIQDGLKEQPSLSRNLTAALWILGVEANTIVSEASEEDDEVPDAAFHKIEDLVTAVESVFWNDWFVEDMRRAR